MALTRPDRLAATIVVVAALGLGTCGGDDDPGPAPTVTTASLATTTTTAATATTTPTSTAPSGHVAAFAFMGGKVSGDSRVTVKLGEPVTIRVVSDVAEEVHVHTFDLMVDLEPGVPGEVTFVADIPGIHEVELEHSSLHLTSLEVQ